MKTGIELISEERERQINVKGWTKENDALYMDESMALAAATYAIPESERSGTLINDKLYPDLWPENWSDEWWKPSPENRIKELQKAGALIAAEIDRLQNK